MMRSDRLLGSLRLNRYDCDNVEMYIVTGIDAAGWCSVMIVTGQRSGEVFLEWNRQDIAEDRELARGISRVRR